MKKTAMAIILCSVLLVPCLHAEAARAETGRGYKAAYCADFYSGTVILSENEAAHLPIASMCKIMTLLLCFEEIEAGRLSQEEEIAVSERASGMGGSQVFLEAGARYPAGELIKSICVASANDSCVAMAERIAGSEEEFVSRMNERAEALGMLDTVFVNCTGLPGTGQYSCAKDVYRMLRALLTHDEYFRYGKIWTDKIEHPKGRVTEMANTNKLIRTYSGCDAGKTGYTDEAGFCLAASAARGNMRVISVVMGADNSKIRFDKTGAAFDHAFANYTNKAILDGDMPLDEHCPLQGGKKQAAAVRPERSAYLFCKKKDDDDIFYELSFDTVKAPVSAGQQVGTAVIYKNGVEADRVALLCNESVGRATYFDSLREIAKRWVS